MNINTIFKILKLGRFHFPLASLSVFSMGALLAVLDGAKFYLDRFLLTYCVILIVELVASYSNNYFDVNVDRYNEPETFSGGTRILLTDPVLLNFTRWLAIVLMVVSFILSTVFVVVFSFPALFLVLVVSGGLLAWFYTAPPVRLSYRGLGEIAVMLAVGLLLPGTGYLVVENSFAAPFWKFVLPALLYALALIINIEIPDWEGDHLGKKNTWVVLGGRSFGFLLTLLLPLLGTLYFFIISDVSHLAGTTDNGLIAVFSLLPLGSAMLCFLKTSRGKTTDKSLVVRSAVANVLSLILFVLILDGYFVFLLN